MTPSTFIARILGPLMVVVGLGLLIQTHSFRLMAIEALRNPANIYFSGFVTLAAALAILNVHNLWVRDWRVIITIFGWLGLIGGIFRILATSFVQNIGLEILTRPRGLVVGAVIGLVIGGYLSIMGYQDIWNEARTGKPRHGASADAAKPPTTRSAKRSAQKSS